MEPLPLRDLHLPDPISWWPPAIGWWIVLALTVLLTAGLVYLIRRWRRVTPVRLALRELTRLEADANLSVREKLQSLSMLMKRLALTLHPREEVAGLAGEAWLRWLDAATGDARFSQEPGRWLVEAPYRPEPSAAELASLLALCRDWVTTQKKSRKARPAAPGVSIQPNFLC